MARHRRRGPRDPSAFVRIDPATSESPARRVHFVRLRIETQCRLRPEWSHLMRFGLFGGASARRGVPAAESARSYHDYVDFHVEAEALGFHGSFVTEHHFTKIGQISATLNLLTWIAARTTTLRLGIAVIVLPWHDPVLLAEQAATLGLLSGGRLDFVVGERIPQQRVR